MRKLIVLCAAIPSVVACSPAAEKSAPAAAADGSASGGYFEMAADQGASPNLQVQLVPISSAQFKLAPELAKECNLQTINATLPNPSISSRRSGEHVLFADLDVVNGQQTVVHALTNNGRKSVTLAWTDPLDNKEILIANFTDGVKASAVRCDSQTTSGTNYQLVNRTVAKIGANDNYTGVEAYIPTVAPPAGVDTTTTFALQTESENGEVKAEWLKLERSGQSLQITASSREFAAAFNAASLGVTKAELERAARGIDTRAEYKPLRDLSDVLVTPADGVTEFSVVPNIERALVLPGVTLDKSDSVLLLGPDKKAVAAGSLSLAPRS